MNTLSNVNIKGGRKDLNREGTTPFTPSINEDNGVSTRSIQTDSHSSQSYLEKRWYVMRTTYGREKKAYEYVISKGGTAFYPTINEIRIINGKPVNVEVSRLPNIFFIKGTEDEVKSYAYDNIHLPYLRFYYGHRHQGVNIIKYPLVIPESQIKSLKIICEAPATDTLFVPSNVRNFEKGELVKVVEGTFKGVEGHVSRWHGQQRVGIIIEGLCTIATAYVPTSFLEKR